MEFPHDKYQRNLKYKKLLGIKRKSDNISDNFVFRSILSDKLKDEYEEVAQNYKNVYSFNWDDSTIVRDKLHPLINLTPDSFLFLVNCMYFPADIVEIDSKKLEAIFNTIITQKSLAIPRKLNPLEAKTFLADLKFFEESDLDLLENTMNTKLKHIEARNSSLYSKLRKIIFPKIYPAIHPDEKEGILKDSLFTSDAQEEHLSFLKYLHHKEIAQIKQAKPIFRFADEEEKENAVHYCCVCNNGDYNEGDNLIYCSECLISVHMGCYGIVDSVPDNWMCNACKVMLKEDVQNLECALCPVKGGAMKISDAKWEQVSKLRGKESHSLFSASTSINTPSDLSLAKVDYSDTVNNFSWVHLSCALWNPEIDIGNFLMKEEIKNIPLLDKKKFKDYCNICKLRNYGPTFKCKHESCTFKAHIECARLNKYCMEIMNVKGTLNYNYYCHDHSEHKVVRIMRDKKNLHKEEVKSFSENILEKIYKSYEKKFQVSLRKPAKIPVRPMKQNLNKKEKYIFIKKLKDLCKLISNLNCIPIRKKTNTDGTLGYEFYRSAYKNKLRYKDIVENKNFPWKLLSIGGHANAKKLFHSVLKDEETYNRLILKRKTAHLEKGNEDNNLYCYCKAKYEGSDFMICCTNESECKGSIDGWFHPRCVEELKNVPRKVLESDKFVFECRECKGLI